MARKRAPIFKRALNVLTFSIPIKKLRTPLSRNLLGFKKPRKLENKRLLKHYNYAFIEEHQFSPSSTPLFSYYKAPFKKKTSRYLYSIFLICRSSKNLRVEGGGSGELEVGSGHVDAMGGEAEPSDSSEDGDSIDGKAEKFIERFYEEMRMQRQESIVQYREMLDRGCG